MTASSIIWSKHLYLDKNELKQLSLIADKSTTKSARINIHQDFESKLQQMVICLKSNAIQTIHLHKDKDEIIHIIKGQVRIDIYDNSNEVVIQTINLNIKNQPFYRINMNTWHRVYALTPTAIFHEICNGPYIKEKMITK